MNPFLIFLLISCNLLISFSVRGQNRLPSKDTLNYEDSLNYYSEDLKPVLIVNPNSVYAYYLNRVRKLYPYALYAADVLHQLDTELATLNKKRLIRKESRETQKELFSEFNYMIRDLYRSEGKLLMKLINRETGMTVDEIIRKYRNNAQANIYTGMAKLFQQDLKIEYHPLKEDRLIEKIIQDIKQDKVYFDSTYVKVTKQDYKEGMKVYRAEKKESRIETRKAKKESKKKKKSKSNKHKGSSLTEKKGVILVVSWRTHRCLNGIHIDA